MSHRRTKKQRTAGLPSFGAPSDSDVPFVSPDQDPSSSASSTRIVGISAPPALTTICARVFVTNFLKLRKDTNTWSRTSHFLRALPDVLIPKIFAMLCNSYPTYLNHEVIVTTDATLLSKFFAELPHGFQLPNLHNLKLRQTSIGDASLHSILNLCPALQRLDISFTTVHHPPHTLADSPIPALEKLSLTSTAVSLSDLVEVLGFLPKLRTLNIGAIGAAYQLSRASLGNTTALTMTDDMLLSLVAVLEQMSFLENVSLVGNAKLGLNAKYPSAMSTFITRVGRKCKVL
ncbi:hypothetical protein H0H92_014147 [Tricholoma furcatifolium]|nr:hypothetical protein H0H92_014147 [Tricholoma furcatifolium]